MINTDVYMNRLFSTASEKGIPVSGTFELTSRCNLRCRMCYIHRAGNDADAVKKEKDTQWWLERAKKATDAGMLVLLLTGGEPLLRKDFDEIYTACCRMGQLVTINSNGSLIGDEKTELFKKYPPFRINITLYGMSAGTYETLCGDGSAFEKTVNAIIRLKQAGINVSINYTLTPYNRDDAAAAHEFAKKLGIKIRCGTYTFAPVRVCDACVEGEVYRLPPEEAAREQLRWRIFSSGEDEIRKGLDGIDRLNALLKKAEDDCTYVVSDRISCRAGSCVFWITWNGQMRPCGQMLVPSVDAEDFDRAWSEIHRLRDEIKLPPECVRCDLKRICDSCAAIAYNENGRTDKVPEYACRKAKEYRRLCDELINR